MPEINLPDEKKNAAVFLTVFERHIFKFLNKINMGRTVRGTAQLERVDLDSGSDLNPTHTGKTSQR
jgi:hypothetical protein